MEYTHLGSEHGHARKGVIAVEEALRPMVLGVPPPFRASAPQGMSAGAFT